MIEAHDLAVKSTDRAHERASQVMRDLVSVASADRVYSEPVVAGDRTVITAAEVQTGMGFGYGLDAGRGHGSGPGEEPNLKARVVSWGRTRGDPGETGPRAGGGGGGQAAGRPVAVITIGPDGVDVQPVLDRTRIALTALMAFGAIGLTLIRLRRGGRP